MHKDISERVTNARTKQIATPNQRTNIIQPNFSLGDFVVVCHVQDKGHKLNFQGIGPLRIVKFYSDLEYVVAKLSGEQVEQVRCACVVLYRNADENTNVSLELLDLAHRTEAQYELVEKSFSIGEDHHGIFLQIQWLGLPDENDRTWVSL